MSLELTNIAVFTSNNKFNIGFGTATFNDSLQVRFTIRKTNAGGEFVSWPQSSYQKDGQTVYVNEVTLAKDVSNDINDQIIAEFNKVLAIGGTEKKKDGGPNVPSADSSAPASSAGTANTKKNKPKVKSNW